MFKNLGADVKSHVFWQEKQQFLFEHDVNKQWSFIAVESGRFHYEIETKKGDAGSGDVVICPPKTPFYRRTLSPLTFHFVRFKWEQELAPEYFRDLIGKVVVTDQERLASSLKYLRQLSGGNRDQAAEDQIRHFVNDILRLIGMEKNFEAEKSLLKKTEGRAEKDLGMLQARLWLNEHAYESLSLRELSDLLGITPVQLTRRYRSAFGVTPSEYVTGKRLDRACMLLKETGLPLDAVAQNCGYENGLYLSRVFHNKLGTRPSIYRKLHHI